MGDIIRFNKARLLEQADRIDTVVDALYRTRLSYEDMRSFLENAEGKVVRAASAEANQMIYKIHLHSDRMESIKEDIEKLESLVVRRAKKKGLLKDYQNLRQISPQHLFDMLPLKTPTWG